MIRFSNPDNVHMKAINALMTMPGADFPAPAFNPHNYESNYPGGVVGPWESRSNAPADSQVLNNQDYTATLTWKITDQLTLTSLTGYRERDGQSLNVQDAADFHAWGRDDRRWDETYLQQEFHLTGSLTDDVSFLAGLYYSDNEAKSRTYEWVTTEFFDRGVDEFGNDIAVLNQERLDYVRAVGAANNDPVLANYTPAIGSADCSGCA